MDNNESTRGSVVKLVANCCAACLDREKTWEGSDPKCAFETGEFSFNNWNCGTAGLIRDLCGTASTVPGYEIHLQHTDGQHIALVNLGAHSILPEYDADGYLHHQPSSLWVSWYKDRGCTEAMWLMFDTRPPRAPTEEECLAILNAYNGILNS